MATKSPKATQPSIGPALKNLTKLIGTFLDVIFSPKGVVTIQNNGAVVRMSTGIPFSEASDCFSIPGSALISALGGRKSPALALRNGTLTISEGRYKVELNSKDAGQVPKPERPEDAEPVVLSDELWAAVSQSLPSLGIDKLHAAQIDPNLTMIVGKKVFLAVQDRHQLAFTTLENPDPGFSLSVQLPYPKALAFFREKPGSGVNVIFGKDLLHAKFSIGGFPAEMSLPWALDEQAPTPEVVFSTAKELSKLTGDTLQFKQADLLQFLENSRAIAADDTRIHLAAEGDSMLLSAESSSGKIKSKIPLSASVGKVEFILELKFLQGVIKRMDEEVLLTYKDNLIKMSSSKLTLVSSTSVA